MHTNRNYRPEDLFRNSEYQALANETAELFTTAIPHETPQEMRAYLEQDIFIFSQLKTHTQLTEARQYLKDNNGNITPYHAFEQKVLKLNKQYNKNYLEAEYEFAVHSSQSAANWANLQNDTNRYWLEYRTAGDERVRANHQALAGVCLPKNDPFWQEFYPPNGWRCRCVAVEVLARDYTKSDSKKAIQNGKGATSQIGKNGKNKLEMFRFNPGHNKKVFPPNNSYTKVVGSSLVLAKIEKKYGKKFRKNRILTQPRKEQFKKISERVYEHKLVNKIDDYTEIKQTAKLLAKNGETTELMPEIYKNETTIRQMIFKHLPKSFKSNPDLRNGNLYYDLKRPKAIKNILGNANKASKQGAIAIISDGSLDKTLTEQIIKERVKDIFNSKGYKMDSVIFKIGNELRLFNRTGDK